MSNQTAEEIAERAFDAGRIHIVADMTNEEIKSKISEEVEEYAQSRLQSLKEEVDEHPEVISSCYVDKSGISPGFSLTKIHQRMIPVSVVEQIIKKHLQQ